MDDNNITTRETWHNEHYTFILMYSPSNIAGKPFGIVRVIRKSDGARLGEYTFEGDPKLALYELGAVQV